MRKLIFILLMGVSFLKGHAQNDAIPYHDAVYMKVNCFDEVDGNFINKQNVIDVLKKYYPGVTDGISNEGLLAIIDANPLLKKYSPHGGFSSAPGDEIVKSSFSLSSIGSTDVTKVVDGLAKFIVDRTKKELQAAFFDRFVEELKNDKYKDIQTLFPATFAVIQRLPSIIYSYEPYIQELREAFGIDFTNLYPHLELVLTNGQYSAFFNNHLELKSVCLTALYFGDGLKKGTHIGLLLENYKVSSPKYQFSDIETDTIKNHAVQFIQQVSRSFRTKEASTKEYWVDAESIKNLLDDEVTFRIYLGLLYVKVQPITVATASTINYGQLIEKIDDANTFISTLASAIEDAQIQLNAIQNKPIDKITIEEFARSFNASMGVLNVFKNNLLLASFYNDSTLFNDTQRAKIKSFLSHYDEVISGANAAISLYTNIKAKNYALAMNNVKTLYYLAFNPEILDVGPPTEKLVDGAKVSSNETKKRLTKIIDFLNDKGAFIASIAKAKTSTEVYNAIDKMALPVGSARVKRLSNTNVAINAYCGFFGGKEVIKDAPEDNDDLNIYGLTAPVGFSFSKGNSILPWPLHRIIPAKGWSSTLFMSVIDIGSVAAYRFKNDTAEQVPTIELKDVFSPGLFWSIGIPKTPISINMGAQVGPNLRKVNDTSNDYSKNTYVRYSFSVVVDIPILNLFTK